MGIEYVEVAGDKAAMAEWIGPGWEDLPLRCTPDRACNAEIVLMLGMHWPAMARAMGIVQRQMIGRCPCLLLAFGEAAKAFVRLPAGH